MIACQIKWFDKCHVSATRGTIDSSALVCVYLDQGVEIIFIIYVRKDSEYIATADLIQSVIMSSFNTTAGLQRFRILRFEWLFARWSPL